MEHTIESVTLEREGLIECIAVLMAYTEEVYKEEPCPGVKMCVDKLRDKITLCDGQLKRLEVMKAATSR